MKITATYNDAKQVIKRVMIKYDASGNISKISNYSVAQKFGTTVNDLESVLEFAYNK